jgi:hypothetical protein
MHLYAGPTWEFVRDSAHNQIAKRMRAAYRSHFGYDTSEHRSWRESFRALSQIVIESGLNDHGVVLEYQLPLSSRRLDCLITGHDLDERSSAVIVEMKSWETAELADGEELVRAYFGGQHRTTQHPSVQANQVRRYLADMHDAFSGENVVRLAACAYLPNYHPKAADPMLADKFSSARAAAPLYTADDVSDVVRFLSDRLGGGRGLPVLARIESGSFWPTAARKFRRAGSPNLRESGSEDTADFPAQAALAPSDIGALRNVVEAIIANYQYLIEHQGIWKLLYDRHGKPLHEQVSQRIFFVVADAYCRANNVDITPEANSGSGAVDFKLSRGYHARVAVELKLSTNSHLSHGYAEQLEAYKCGERTAAAYFVVLDVEGGERQLDRATGVESIARAAGKPHSPIVVIDATRKRPASRR